MDWTNEMVIEFLKVYEAEPILWDPKHPERKKKHSLTEAWRRIHKTLRFTCTVEDLKKKRDSLMAYYRIHLGKIRKLRTLETTEDDYKTNWFAYDAMSSFLGNINDSSAQSCTPEDISIKGNRLTQENKDSTNGAEYQRNSKYQLKRKQRTQEENSRSAKRMNECEMYVKLLVHKLIKLDGDDRLTLMNKIDNLVFETTMEVNARKNADTRASALNSWSTIEIFSANTESIQTKTSRLITNSTSPKQNQSPVTNTEEYKTIELEYDMEIKEEF